MARYQNSVLKKYLAGQDQALVKQAYEKYTKYFHNAEIQENIRNSKEEQFQEGFLRELFVAILGYTLNPNPDFNLTTEFKNEKGSKKADGAILKPNGKAIGVIELKGTDTVDLDKINIQAFNYKNNQSECVYIITSNFEKLRFYINDTLDPEEFNLFSLTEQRFAVLWLFLQKDNLLGGIPLKVKDESKTKEEKITKLLYDDYAAFKQELWQNLVTLNKQTDELLLYKKSQKLLDRFLFIFFAEDKGLLPPNMIATSIEKWEQLKALDYPQPLYDVFKQLFGFINTGRKGTAAANDIFAYNGGLFLADEVLDTVTVSDELLKKHVLKLTAYDFDTEVDTNILGHIFEHSLNDIENVRAQLAGEEIDKSKTKRKKDGVFYTPKYITKYIVENTIGKLCEEKKAEIGIDEQEFAKDRKGRRKDTIKKLDAQLKTYRAWLLQLTICDPACGSGAFLNQALEFLIAEHHYIDELEATLFEGSIVFQDVESHILENNIYGVDINEESVEIARLSLWLRTARIGRKLTSLSSNIKCGNSLIDDPAVAGSLAFNWQNEFPEVFAKGGFDVVIGNPPYVRQELFKEIKPFLEKSYKCYNSIADLYTYFIEKGIQLMNLEGKFSFILPNKFIKASYGKEVRKVILENVQIELIYDFDDYPVFEDATTYPLIFVFAKQKNGKLSFDYSEINKRNTTSDPIGMLITKAVSASYKSLNDENWQIQDNKNENLLKKLKEDSILLKDVVNDKIFRGVSTGKNEVFIINKETADKLKNENNKQFIREIVTGKEVKRYNLTFDNLFLLYIPWEYDLEYDINIKQYLVEHKETLSNRPEVKEGRFNWWCLSRYGSKNSQYLFQPKIIYPRINSECNFFFDSSGDFSLSDNNFFISTDEKYLLPILNSKIIFYFLKSIASTLQGGYLDFRRPYIEIIPIKIPTIKSPFIEKADQMLLLNKELQKVTGSFLNLLQSKYTIEKLSTKLQNWYELEFGEFLKELKKAKVQLVVKEEAEWLTYFTEQKQQAQQLKKQIDQTDKEIDRMVYALYELTEEEIAIVENA